MTGKSKIFRRARPADVESVLAKLTSKDPDLWAAEWSRVARPYEEAGKAHEQAGRINQAREAYIQAYTYYAAGRYPVPHSSGKLSLKEQGWLNKPSCRMLLINGKDDVQTPIADLYISWSTAAQIGPPCFQAGTWARLHKPCQA
jgi:hypothetical protein